MLRFAVLQLGVLLSLGLVLLLGRQRLSGVLDSLFDQVLWKRM